MLQKNKKGANMFKKHKNKIIISSLVIVGIILILAGSFSKKQSSTQSDFDAEIYTEKLEKKIEDFLKNVEGIKNANVIITLDTSKEDIYAQNQSTFDYLIISSSNGESGIKISEVYPTVRGIAIACTNGDNPDVQYRITEIISKYLGISSNRIKIVSIS
jgi:hypothetical protein